MRSRPNYVRVLFVARALSLASYIVSSSLHLLSVLSLLTLSLFLLLLSFYYHYGHCSVLTAITIFTVLTVLEHCCHRSLLFLLASTLNPTVIGRLSLVVSPYRSEQDVTVATVPWGKKVGKPPTAFRYDQGQRKRAAV